MSASESSENIRLVSKGLYLAVCSEIGSKSEIQARQQSFVFYDIFKNCENPLPFDTIWGGSRAEGFDFEKSDADFMNIIRTVLVLPDKCLFTLFVKSCKTVILMRTDCVPPGFALLRCLQINYNNEIVLNSLTQRGCDFYVCSKFIRETFLANFNREVHGPCQTGCIGELEYDLAYTLKCPVWPDQARSFINRSTNSGWPQIDILKDICNDGCLFVPINSKQRRCNDNTDLEWRISFSHAERKHILSMYHCQFLCYGLLKVFQKEVLKNHPNEDLLCSYFLKTALFWEICENGRGWIPEYFMLKFWNVFRRIIKWVSFGYCPNYFIPENNMFYGKIYGVQQSELLRYLGSLHADGYGCLLKCPMLSTKLRLIIQVPQFMYYIPDDEMDNTQVELVERQRLQAICFQFEYQHFLSNKLIKILVYALRLCSTLDGLMYFAVKLQINMVLQQIAERYILFPKLSGFRHITNKEQYSNTEMGKSILRKTRSFLCCHQIIYAKYLYVSGNNYEAVDTINFIKCKLQSQMYLCTRDLSLSRYFIDKLQQMSYDKFVNTFVMKSVCLPVYSEIEELCLEYSVLDTLIPGRELKIIPIPSLVFLNLLLILSYTKLNENEKRKEILEELELFVSNGGKELIDHFEKAISWDILGICQQICGDYRGAYQSYIKAVKQEICPILQAIWYRLMGLTMQIMQL